MDRAHLFLVHFPIALLLASVLFEVIGHLRQREDMQKAGYYTLVLGCVGAVLAAVTGLGARQSLSEMLTRRPGAAEALNAHTVAGLAVTVLFMVLLLWRTFGRRTLQGSAWWGYMVLALAGSAAVVVTGFSGGTLAHPQHGAMPPGPFPGATAPTAATPPAAAPGAAAPSAATVKAEEVWARPSRPMNPEAMGGAMANPSGMAGHGGGHGSAAMGATSAIYLTLVNAGDRPDALVAVHTDVAAVVELHETRVENDVMRMQPVADIPVPAGGRVELKPGGLHIMLMGVKEELNPGDRFEATLVFAEAGSVPIAVTVRES